MDCNQTLNNKAANSAQPNTHNINFKNNKCNELRGVQGTSVCKNLNIVDNYLGYTDPDIGHTAVT